MSHQRPATRADTGTVRSIDGDRDDGGRAATDEQQLYGTPCHEDGAGCDEQTLYGEPQHETDLDELPDVELLLARLESEAGPGSPVDPRGDRTSTATTER